MSHDSNLLPLEDEYIGQDISIFKNTFIIIDVEPFTFCYYTCCNKCIDDYIKIYNFKYEYLKMNELIPPEENISLDYFRRLADDEQRLRQKQTAVSDEPYRLLGSYQIFTDTTRGLGSPYAHLFPLMTDMLPPSSEPFGEINLDPITW